MTSSRKKHIILFSAVIITVAVAAVLYQSSPAYMECTIDDDSIRQVYPDEVNAMTLKVRQWGRASSLHLTLTFTNASFSNQTEQPYDQVNSTAVKFANLSSNKTVCFNVDKNVTGFAVDFSYEFPDPNLNLMMFWKSLSFKWNETEKCFIPWQGGAVVA
jgi:hypothetical protein